MMVSYKIKGHLPTHTVMTLLFSFIIYQVLIRKTNGIYCIRKLNQSYQTLFSQCTQMCCRKKMQIYIQLQQILANILKGQQDLRFKGPQILAGALQICIYRINKYVHDDTVGRSLCASQCIIDSASLLWRRDGPCKESSCDTTILGGMMPHSQPRQTITTTGNK